MDSGMNLKSDVHIARKTDRQRIADVDLDSLTLEQLKTLKDEIFGEPSDEEIAQALRKAQAEFKAGDCRPKPLDAQLDDEPYREPTRQQNLQGIKAGFTESLAGLGRPIQELLDELEQKTHCRSRSSLSRRLTLSATSKG